MNWSKCRPSGGAGAPIWRSSRREYVARAGPGIVLGEGVGRASPEGRPRGVRSRAVRTDPLRNGRPPARRRGAEGIAQTATVEGQRLPSIETFLHALCCNSRACSLSGTRIPRSPSACSAACAAAIFLRCLFPEPDRGTRPAMGLCAIRRSRLAAGLGGRAQALAEFSERHQPRARRCS